MNILIVEDEPLAVDRNRQLLHQINPDYSILGPIGSVTDAVEWLLTHPAPNLILLDIQLSDGKCFDIFNRVTVESPIIFTTAYDQFAIEAFKLNSIDYLLKPVSKEALESAVAKYQKLSFYASIPAYKEFVALMKNQGRQYKNRFLLKAGKKLLFKEVDEILYFYADDKTVFLVLENGEKWMVDHSLENLQELLDPKIFFRFNRKIISRIRAIKEIKTYPNSRLKVTLQAGIASMDVIISRERVSGFKAWAQL